MDVRGSIQFQERFAALASQIDSSYPGAVSGFWTEPLPAVRAHIRFAGSSPAGVELLVRTAGLNVAIAEGGEMSMGEQHERARVAFDALVLGGYRNVVTFYDLQANAIRVEIQQGADLPSPSLEDVARTVQAFQDAGLAGDDTPFEAAGLHEGLSARAGLSGRAASFRASDFDVLVFGGHGPLVHTDGVARGGTWLRDDGVRECTGGFTVFDNAGVQGVMSAGHCAGLNQFEDPGVEIFGMGFKDQSWLEGGDVEWYTTVRAEWDDFFRDANNTSDVAGKRITNTMPGNTVCRYGRQSNVQRCNHTVEAVFVNVLADGQVPVGDLARTTNHSGQPGDSGGPWFVGTVAWGIHHGGDANGKSYFTTIQQAEAQLAVHVKVQ